MRSHADSVLTPGGPLGVFSGVMRVLDLPNPGPGVEWALPVPSQGAVRIRSILATLTTSATVANRVPGLVLKDPDRVAFASSANVAVPATTVQTVVAMPGTGSGGLVGPGGVLLMPLLDMIVPVGWTLSSNTGNIIGGDTYTNVRLVVEEFDTYPAGFPFGRVDQYDHRYDPDNAASKEIR